MIAIAAVDLNWGIGYKGKLLISLPEDQRGVFRKYTAGHTVVYGRKTLETFKDCRLLPGRTNVILTRNRSYVKEGAVILHSEGELDTYITENPEGDSEIYLIGGETMYNSLIGLCDEAVITYIHAGFTADAFFPNLDLIPEWSLISEEDPVMSEKGVEFTVRHYKRNN